MAAALQDSNFVWKVLLFTSKLFLGLIATVLTIGVTLGFLFKFYPWTVGYFVFMNHIHFPPFRDFSDLASYNLRGRNFYLENEHNHLLGVWHLEPDSRDDVTADFPVVIYNHGAQGSRAAYHRIQLYRVLQKMGSPVVTFDYRGYGDSTGVPESELDLFEDAMLIYEWTSREYPKRPIFFWGHSLGTGVSVRLVQTLEKSGVHVDGLILDSPYSSMYDVMQLSPLLLPFHQVPAFTKVLLEALEEAHVTLNSSERIRSTRVPLLILHAEDDWVIPVSLSKRLYEVARHREANVLTEFIQYSAEFRYGHRGIYRDPNLPKLTGDFMLKCSEWKRKFR